MKTVISGIGIVAILLGAVFGLNYFGYLNTAFFAPKYEGVRHDVMIESRAYSEGTIRELYTLQRDALGYGFPYATQYTNPMRDTYYGGGTTAGSVVHFQMPQPEPNGLFMPNAADGTWIMRLNPETKDVQPVYIEPRVVVSPFPLFP